MRTYNLCTGGRALSIAIGTMLVFIVFMGGAGALSDVAVSDYVWDIYPDVASSNSNFPDHPPGIPLYRQRADRFSNPDDTEKMPVQTAAAGDVNITKIGHFGGLILAVEVSGNYVYTSQEYDFVVLDISNNSAPAEAGRVETSGYIRDIVLVGNYAYVADSNGLVIVDVSNPEVPIRKGSYITAGYSMGVAVVGNYAYVADRENGLVIVDVTNPVTPTLKGSYDTSGYSYGVAVAGNYAYVADYTNGLVIVDVTDPAAPTLKGSYDTAGYSMGVAVVGNYAYVADGENGLVILDVSNPAVPTLKGGYNTAGYSEEVTVVGNYAYVADYTNGFVIVNVSNPAAPTLKGSYDTAGSSWEVAVAGNYAYVADGDNGLEIFRIEYAPTNFPPASITNLHNITFAQTYIKWTWTDPADEDFDKVRIYLDGSFQTNVTKGVQYYNATGLTAGSTHTIATRTMDTIGNINQSWVNHTSRTANAATSSISSVTITPTNPSAGNEINITVSINNPGASFNGTVEGNIWLPGGTGKYLGWKNIIIPTGTSTVTIIGAAGGAKSSYITHDQGTHYYDVFLENVDKGEYYLTATDSRLSVPFTVGPAGSVYMSNIVLSAAPTVGSVMTLKVTISNPTSSAFTGTMDANIWDSVRGYVLTPQSISIAAGSSTTLTFSYTPVNHGLHSYDFFMVSDIPGQNTKGPWGFVCMDYVAGIGFTVV